jgi:hypothetical protein
MNPINTDRIARPRHQVPVLRTQTGYLMILPPSATIAEKMLATAAAAFCTTICLIVTVTTLAESSASNGF